MYWLRRLLLLLPGRLQSRSRELEEELRANLELALDDAAESGGSPEEAARQARRDFGNITRAREEARSVWLPGWDRISQDVRFALRTLYRARAFSLVAILSLGIGTGAAEVTANLFQLLGVQPQAGRAFRPEEEQPGKGNVVIMTDSLWRSRFGASPTIVGQTIQLSDASYVVAGVLPPSFRFPKNDDLGPLTVLAERTDLFVPMQDVNPGWGGDYDYIVFGRLRNGVAPAQAVGELNPLEGRIAAGHKLPGNLHVRATPCRRRSARPSAPAWPFYWRPCCFWSPSCA